MIKGTDLAYCNINVNYKMMRDSDIRFAIIKLVQGLQAKDPMFDIHRMGCESVEVPWDLYDFCDYRYSGAANVSNMIAKANGNWGRRNVCQDLEFRAIWGYPDGWHMLRFCLDWFESFELQTNICGTLYTNRDLLGQMWTAANIVQKQELARHKLWLATDDATPSPAQLPIEINQWDLDAVVPWSQGAVDFDDFMLGETEFSEFIGETPSPLTIEERVDRIEAWITTHGGW